MKGVSRVRMLLGHGVMLAVGLVALALTLVSCLDSPIEGERQALEHAKQALEHAQRLIPLLQTQLWEEAYKQTAKVKGELEEAIAQLDQAMKGWARRGQSPLPSELEALSLLNEVAQSNQSIQDKLSSPETITTSIQNRLIERAKENAQSLERAVGKLEKAIEQRLTKGG
jgi:predicted O-linked N-acetylglucosamine transferase (SPINDLY family)